MAERLPIVLLENGMRSELPEGDTIGGLQEVYAILYDLLARIEALEDTTFATAALLSEDDAYALLTEDGAWIVGAEDRLEIQMIDEDETAELLSEANEKLLVE